MPSQSLLVLKWRIVTVSLLAAAWWACAGGGEEAPPIEQVELGSEARLLPTLRLVHVSSSIGLSPANIRTAATLVQFIYTIR